MGEKKTVFLTGGTGTMGWAGFQELFKRKDHFNIVLLARASKKNKEKLLPYLEDPAVRVVWGDLTKYDDVLQCVTGADYVLHVGGMVSPAADYKPISTRRVNVGAATNIAKAVLSQPNADDIKVVYIGSVAQTGDRNPPIHWARTGDPIKISVYDHYAISKTIAERAIVDSGIKKWVCLRQSGILYPEILKNYDPIMFHVPINGVLEWATVEDSGRLLANVCEDSVPEEFWNRFYNIGSGSSYRITNYEFEEKLLRSINCPPVKKIFNPNWFTLRNFHGQWYADSDLLEEYLHFRGTMDCDEYFQKLSTHVPGYYKLAKIIPAPLIKNLGMRPMAHKLGLGTMDWIKKKIPARVTAYFGSMKEFNKIKTWDDVDTSRPSEVVTYLDHGYDESKPKNELTIEDMRQAAEFRGGECLSESMEKGNLAARLRWKCQFGHEFEASPALILLGGHWCPDCLPEPWNYDEIAKGNPFFAQVWFPLHGREERNFYGKNIFDGWETEK